MPRKVTVPRNALTLHDSGNDAQSYVSFSSDSEGKVQKVQMLAYSGKVIKDHWYWGDLMINVSGITFSKPLIPILEDHNPSKKIGFAKKPSVDGNKVFFEEITVLDNDVAREFVSNSKQGFPYQASIRADPTKILRLMEGEVVEVNGSTFKGPGTVWEKCSFKESSVCVFGWDSNTNSKAFAKDGETEVLELESDGGFSFGEPELEPSKEDTMPFDFSKLEKEHPEDYSAFVKSIKDEAAESLSKDNQATLSEKDAEIEKLSKEKETIQAELTTHKDSFKELERKVTLMSEKAMDAEASEVWETALSDDDCNIPVHLHSKIQKQVTRTEFMTKEGEFDVAAFSEAVKKEIAEWQVGLEKTVIKGAGSFTRSASDDTKDDDDAEEAACASRMAEHISGHGGKKSNSTAKS